MARAPRITSPYAPDLGEVRVWLERMIAALKFVELVAAILALIGRMRDANTELTKQLAGLRRKRPRSETLERLERQLLLPLGAIASVEKPKTAAADDAKNKPTRKGRHPGRAAPPPHLERVPDKNLVPPKMRICPICGSEMKTLGYSHCEIYDIVPAKIVVIDRMDERVVCPHDDAIVSAPVPPAIVERGKLSDRFIVEVLCDKYVECQPVERQCSRFARAGVEIAPQTLGRGIATAIDLLMPVANLIHQKTRGPGLLGTDSTNLPVLDRQVTEGIRSGGMWCWTNARWVAFFYSPSADSNSVRRFLGDDLARTVQCDGTNVTTFLERAGGKRPGCWSHARRGLVEAARLGDAVALDGVRKIAPLFAIERESTLAGDTADQRRARRLEHTQPVLEDLRAWVDGQRAITPPKTPLGRALGYLYRQWRRLILFMDDGNIEATNNRRERELRRLILGRKNWLFTWLDIGGERTAAILSIVASCIAHDVDPRAYLHLVTKLVVHGWPQAKLQELLPDRIVVAHPELYIGDHDVLPALTNPGAGG